MKKYLVILFLLIAMPCFGADQTLYVRDGAAGTGTGADWTNACEELSLCEAKVNRADYDNVYIYVADGNYAGRIVFDSPENGSRMVYIYKATVAAHGTETGWDNAYGDGQAVINAALVASTYQQGIAFRTGFYELNGKAGTGSDYSTYGFKVIPSDSTHSEQLIGLPILGDSSRQVDNITIKYVAMVNTGIGDGSKGRFGIYSIPSAGNNSYNITVSNCYFSGGHVNIYPLYAHHWIIENSYFADNWSSSANHGEQIAPRNCDDFIIRNNIFKNTSLYVVGSHSITADAPVNYRYQIYNNIIDGVNSASCMNSAFGNATASSDDTNLAWDVHHNTVMNVSFGGTGCNSLQGFVFTGVMTDTATNHHHVYNNIFYNCTNPRLNHVSPYTTGQVVHDYNAFMACSAGAGEVPDEDHDQTDAAATSAIFTDYAGSDFTIAAANQAAIDHIIGKGTTLASPFDIDYLGVSRTAPFDIGAYDVGGSTDSAAPTLAEVTPVSTPSSNQAPHYVFSSDEAGTVTYGGTCGNGSLSTAVVGDNTVQWNLGIGTYSDCTITVTDAASNASTPLAITEFVITPTDSTAVQTISGGVSFQQIP